MLDIKLFAVACVAFFFVWRVFSKKKQQKDATGEDLFQRVAHDIVLSILTNDNRALTTKLRVSYEQNLAVTIGRMSFNMLQLSNPLISSEHAAVKWNAESNCWLLKDTGSMNGTRLNETMISAQNRRPGEEHPLRDGDVIVLAEDVKIGVRLEVPRPMPESEESHRQKSALKLAPRQGTFQARPPSSSPGQITGRGSQTAHAAFLQRPLQEEYYSEGINAEFAVLAQVGTEHLQSGKSSEDVMFWQLPFANFIRSGIFGICDGHLGAEVSTAIPRLFPSVLSDKIHTSSNALFSSSSDCAPYLHDAFIEVDAQLDTDEGSTATILLAERSENGEACIQAANVGDSLAILIDTETGQYTALTADHRVANESERERLRQLGNPVKKNSTRLYMLNLARAMGDSSLKKINTALIAVPYCSPVIRIAPNKTHVIVVATDGLWDCVPCQEVTELAVTAMQNWEGLRAFGHALIKLATLERGATDDISLFLTRL